MAWTTPKTWTDNVDVLSATNLNTHLRDNLDTLASWVAYTPTLVGTSGTFTLGNGGLSGAHITIGNRVLARVKLSIGTTTSVGSSTVWKFGLPSTIATGSYALGTAAVYDNTSAVLGTGHAFQVYDEYDFFYIQFEPGDYVDYNTPIAWAAGDMLFSQVEYVKQ